MLDAICVSGPLSSKERQPVNILWIEKNGFVEEAERSQFVCKKCSVAMKPVFPLPTKPGRKLSPRAYFRASSHHDESCPFAPREETSNTSEDEPRANAHPIRAKAPTKFIETSDKPSIRKSIDNHAFLETSNESHKRIKRTGHSRSGTSVNNLRSIATVWHADPQSLRDHELKISGCPGNTYATVFRCVSNFLHDGKVPRNRYIYWVHVEKVEEKTSGYKVLFGVKDRSGRYLNCYIQRQLAGEELPLTVCDLLESKSAATLYVLAAFAPNGPNTALVIEPASVNHIWVEPGHVKLGPK